MLLFRATCKLILMGPLRVPFPRLYGVSAMALLRAEVLPLCRQQAESLLVQPGSPGKTDNSQINRFPPAGCLRWTRRDLHSRQQQQCMQLAKDSKNQIPRSAGCVDVSGSTSQAGAGEKFLQRCGFHSKPVSSSAHGGRAGGGPQSWQGAAITGISP